MGVDFEAFGGHWGVLLVPWGAILQKITNRSHLESFVVLVDAQVSHPGDCKRTRAANVTPITSVLRASRNAMSSNSAEALERNYSVKHASARSAAKQRHECDSPRHLQWCRCVDGVKAFPGSAHYRFGGVARRHASLKVRRRVSTIASVAGVVDLERSVLSAVSLPKSLTSSRW